MLLESKPGEINSKIIDFKLKSVNGKFYSPGDFSEAKVLVIIFMCNHCPYVKGVLERFIAFQDLYRKKNVQVIGINPNDTDAYPEDSYENMVLFSKERNFNFPYLIDPTQETAKAYKAVCTPDIYVYDEKRLLKYRGRFDDNWQDVKKITSNDLMKAVDLILAGKEINFKQIPSMGCSIKWKS